MKKQSPQGFTLIELLVAVGVTALIAALMITMVSNLLTVYNRSSGSLSTQGQAALVLDTLAEELESIVLRRNEDRMLRVELATTLQGSPSSKPNRIGVGLGDSPAAFLIDPVPPPPSLEGRFQPLEEYSFGAGGTDLIFFTSAPPFDPVADGLGVRAVRYRLANLPVHSGGGAPTQYVLLRTEMSAQETFDEGYDLTSGGHLGPLGVSDQNDILAGDVIDFGVRLFRLGDNGVRQRVLFPAAGGATASGDPFFYGSASNRDQQYPDVAEIFLRMLTPEGARQVQEPGITGDRFWEIVRQNSQVFTRTVRIPSRPL